MSLLRLLERAAGADVREHPEHPDWLSDEDGEQLWLRQDLAADERHALRRLQQELSLDDEDMAMYEPCGLVPMRRATLADVRADDGGTNESGAGLQRWQVEDGWYLACADGDHDVRYWKVAA